LLVAYPFHPVADGRVEESDSGFLARLRSWLTIVAAVALIEALYGIYQVLAQSPHIYGFRKTAYLDSATGTFVNRNHLAGYFELGIPITIALALIPLLPRRRAGGLRLGAEEPPPLVQTRVAAGLFLLAGSPMIIAMGLTQSRGGVISALCSLVFGAILLGVRRRQLTAKRIAAGAAALFALAMLWSQSPQLLGRFTTEMDLSPYSRPSVWRETMVMAWDFPAFGIGLGNFEFVFPRYQPSGTSLYFDRAHNEYLQLLSEIGLVGCAPLAWWFARLLLLVRRRVLRLGHEATLVVVGLLSGLVALLLHSFTDFNLHIPSNALLFVLALAASLRLLDRDEGAVDWVPARSGTCIAGLLFVAVAAVLAARNWQAESLARSVFPVTSLVNPHVDATSKPESYAERLERVLPLAGGHAELATALAWTAQELAEHEIRGRRHQLDDRGLQRAADAWATAARGYLRSVELRPSVAYSQLGLGLALSNLGGLRHGLLLPQATAGRVTAILGRAVELRPNDPTLTRTVAEWSISHWGILPAGDREKAAGWVRRALTVDPLRGRELLRLALTWDPKLPEQLVPDDPEVRFFLALAYRDAGLEAETTRVIGELEAALSSPSSSPALDPNRAHLLGRVRELRGDWRGAAEAYDTAGMSATADHQRADAYKRSGYGWLEAGEVDRARDAFTHALRWRRRDPEVLVGLSAVHERRGDFVVATRWAQDALAASQGAAEYRYRLARLYERGRQLGKANEQYRRVLEEAQDDFAPARRVEILLALARNYRQLELVAHTREYYDLVLQADPANSEAREFLSYFGP
jgi:O-antigen ligase/tetratricopeptide (TPR) repeat protein